MMAKLTVQRALLRAQSHEKKGEIEQARALYSSVLEAFPNNARAAAALAGLANPNVAAAAAPSPAQEQLNTVIALFHQGQLPEMLAQAQALVARFPASFRAWNLIGVANKAIGDLAQAERGFRRAAELNPGFAEAHNNLGVTLQEQGKFTEAIAACERALALKPEYAEAHFNIGLTLKEQGKPDAAIAAYRRALSIKPDDFEALTNLGNAALDQGRLDEAIASYQHALALKPDYAEAHYNMSVALQEQGRFDVAIAECECALALKPEYAWAESQLLHLRQHVCDWSGADRLEAACARLGITTQAVSPFGMLAAEDSPSRQLARAQAASSQHYRQPPMALPVRAKARPHRLRIGYFSADFHDHATLYLMAGLLREHDKQNFELFAYSYGRTHSGAWRKRAEADVEHFFDVTDLSDLAIAELARTHQLDIAIDLKGYTQHTRSGILQFRPAPIQINYLGYPGSMGADFIDYIVADPIVIPEAQRPHYSEKILYLPNSYQPNDGAREIAQTATTRADFALPEDGFVFCCFNNSYKITPREFDIWMRLLAQEAGAVLWLMQSNQWAEGNLRTQAALRGIDPARLVFAEKLAHAEHLARHKHADLFIDTFNYNAHTTASDALWAGLPVVSKVGKQFAARVGASLLQAVALPELIAASEQDYEALILDLTRRPDRLAAIRHKLWASLPREPLFDTKRYTRNLESGLRIANDLYLDGKPAQDIWVSEQQ